MDAQDIAHFLYKGEGLNKTAIGKLYAFIKVIFFISKKKTKLINLVMLFFFCSNAMPTYKIIGDYLGEKNDFNEQVLRAFVELHDFTNLILVQALR